MHITHRTHPWSTQVRRRVRSMCSALFLYIPGSMHKAYRSQVTQSTPSGTPCTFCTHFPLFNTHNIFIYLLPLQLHISITKQLNSWYLYYIINWAVCVVFCLQSEDLKMRSFLYFRGFFNIPFSHVRNDGKSKLLAYPHIRRQGFYQKNRFIPAPASRVFIKKADYFLVPERSLNQKLFYSSNASWSHHEPMSSAS